MGKVKSKKLEQSDSPDKIVGVRTANSTQQGAEEFFEVRLEQSDSPDPSGTMNVEY